MSEITEIRDKNDANISMNSSQRTTLPVTKNKHEILYSLSKYSTLIVIAETGSGKTTQIPKFLIEAGYTLNSKNIVVSLPRRMAAISVSQRVSFELGTHLGDIVGYHVRFDERTPKSPGVVFMTDGMLVKFR